MKIEIISLQNEVEKSGRFGDVNIIHTNVEFLLNGSIICNARLFGESETPLIDRLKAMINTKSE